MHYRGKERYKNFTLESGTNVAAITASAAEINVLDGATASTAEINQLVGTTLANGATLTGSLVKITETVAFGDFTDGGAAVGTYAMTAGNIPAGAIFLATAVEAVTGFAGNVSASLTIGDGTDVDRYHTGAINVFATAATGIDVGVPSGATYHPVVKTPTLVITASSDFTAVSAGSITVSLYYLM